jgi:hypothetical protein
MNGRERKEQFDGGKRIMRIFITCVFRPKFGKQTKEEENVDPCGKYKICEHNFNPREESAWEIEADIGAYIKT